MSLHKDLREFIECLNLNRVEYLIVGSLAVAWHGYSRYSSDVDFLVRPSTQNAKLVLKAIRQFGFGSLDIDMDDLISPAKVIQLGLEPNRIDLMTSLTSVTFDDAWPTRSPGYLEGIPLNFIGKAALLRNKESTNRSKDRVDVEELRKLPPRA